MRFLPIFDPFLVLKQPIFKAFSMAHNAPPRAQNGPKHLFEHPKWSRNNFEKNDFFRPRDPGGPTVGPCARGVLPSGSTK